MKYLVTLMVIFSGAISATENQTTICTNNDSQRTIEVVYPQDSTTLCEVRYSKDTEMKVLWSANADSQYCQEKASAFIEKQRGWGWSCETAETNQSTETAPTES